MAPLPTLTVSGSSEEWNDAEFDFLDGEPMHTSDTETDKEEEEDWDMEMDLGKTGGAKAHVTLEDAAVRCVAARSHPLTQGSGMITIRPPLPSSNLEDDDDEGEGPSTIKISALPQASSSKPTTAVVDEDFEDDLVIPSDMTELALRPISLLHRASKSSMEWGEREHTTSSLSSDAFSTLGFTDNSTPSSYTSASQPETETEDEEEEDVLDGLVVPSGLFESGQGARKLVKILETKKKAAPAPLQVAPTSPDPEDDFEAGLVLDDDMELSPSRLKLKANQTQSIMALTCPRSKSVPPRISVPNRPPSRLKSDKEKANYPPVSSVQQLRRLPAPTPQLASSSRAPTYSQILATAPSPSSSGSALSPKFGGLRSQKSHTGLKPPSPPSTRRLTRKASLPALESSTAQASTSGSSSSSSYAAATTRYDAHTASSRAKIHTHSTSRISTIDYNVPPTRPSTPSSNPVALRLTMPTSSSRLKSRAPISSVFPQSSSATPVPPLPRSASPLPASEQAGPSRPPSTSSSRSRTSASQAPPPVPAPKILKRPKRLKTYGDGTELDCIEDLPLDRDKEGRYRVQPKPYVNRVPGASYAQKDEVAVSALGERVASRRSLKQDTGPVYPEANMPHKTLKRTSRIGFGSSVPVPELNMRKKKKPASGGHTRRKPTLIRNLGGTGAAKVVGEMRWNPLTLRWEGNDQVLRDFDAAVGTSVRPALITQLTGSSIGSPTGPASGARVVGNMLFDPTRMCWVSTLPPEDEEPDVFADLADDEDDEWDMKGATIRAGLPQQPLKAEDRQAEATLSRMRSMSMSETDSDRCSRGSLVYDVEDGFVDKCRLAEERHKQEMKNWLPTRGRVSPTPNRAFLYEIRALATRQY